DGFRLEFEMFQINQLRAKLLGKKFQQAVFVEKTHINQYPAEFATGFFLLGQGLHQLAFSDDLVLRQQIADADFLSAAHGYSNPLTGGREVQEKKRLTGFTRLTELGKPKRGLLASLLQRGRRAYARGGFNRRAQ